MAEQLWTEPTGEALPLPELLRQRFRWLESFSDDELRELSWCAAGLELVPNEEYVDLSRPERGIITVDRPTPVRDGECYVPASAVSDRVWEKLTRFGR